MTDTLDIRMAHLEGAYEQVDRRLGVIETTLVHLRSDLNVSNGHLRADINQLRSELMARMDGFAVRMDGLTTRVDGRIESLEGRMESRMDGLTARMESQFHWLLGTIFTSWVTLLLAIFFRS